MGLVVLPGALSNDWLNLCQRQNLADRDLRFVPFEDESAVWPQDPERLSKPGAQVAEYGALILLIEPEHARTAAHVQNSKLGHIPHPHVTPEAASLRQCEITWARVASPKRHGE